MNRRCQLESRRHGACMQRNRSIQLSYMKIQCVYLWWASTKKTKHCRRLLLHMAMHDRFLGLILLSIAAAATPARAAADRVAYVQFIQREKAPFSISLGQCKQYANTVMKNPIDQLQPVPGGAKPIEKSCGARREERAGCHQPLPGRFTVWLLRFSAAVVVVVMARGGRRRRWRRVEPAGGGGRWGGGSCRGGIGES